MRPLGRVSRLVLALAKPWVELWVAVPEASKPKRRMSLSQWKPESRAEHPLQLSRRLVRLKLISLPDMPYFGPGADIVCAAAVEKLRIPAPAPQRILVHYQLGLLLPHLTEAGVYGGTELTPYISSWPL